MMLDPTNDRPSATDTAGGQTAPLFDIYGHQIEPGADIAYASKGRLNVMRVEAILPDRVRGVTLTGRRVTIRQIDHLVRAFGWDFVPERSKRRRRI